jgi:thiamine kinase-like enzyme
MADIALAPAVLMHGQLDDGVSIMVQPFLIGRTPTQPDYRLHLVEVAGLIRKMHYSQPLREILPPASSNLYKDAGFRALNRLSLKWQRHQSKVSKVAEFVDRSFEYLALQINRFSGEGLIVSHGDICNANWLFASDGKIYLFDFESMSMEDPALDLGALLWWYYPPELRGRFLDLAGYQYDDELKFRMRVRMAMHCLDITLPREQSFDTFDPDKYDESLRDFRAILNGEENPQGYAIE